MAKAKAKEEGRVKLTECFFCGRIGHIRADCRAKTHINGGHAKSAPKAKGVGSCEDEETETSQNVPLGNIDLGSFEVLSDRGDEVVRGKSWTRLTLSVAWQTTNWEGLCGTPWQMDAPELKMMKKVTVDEEGTGPPFPNIVVERATEVEPRRF